MTRLIASNWLHSVNKLVEIFVRSNFMANINIFTTKTVKIMRKARNFWQFILTFTACFIGQQWQIDFVQASYAKCVFVIVFFFFLRSTCKNVNMLLWQLLAIADLFSHGPSRYWQIASQRLQQMATSRSLLQPQNIHSPFKIMEQSYRGEEICSRWLRHNFFFLVTVLV